ncbi:MAG: phosphodiester glycosidase family protein [Sandaracinaceae bacterium]|nr:phosphodiester glycosidase family protein [Sandaracinaceae bacterium]
MKLACLLWLQCIFAIQVAEAQEVPRAQTEALDVWSEPRPGLRYLHRTIESPRTEIHALVVDLRTDGVRIAATRQDDRWSTVSEHARHVGAAAAVNGGFWGVWQRPTGVTAGGGALWDNAEPDFAFGHFAILDDGRAVVNGPGEGEDERSLARVREAVSGRPLLVAGAEPALDSLDLFPSANQRQPRTAAGVSRDGRTVYFVVADGRQEQSRGLTLYQLARELISLGAYRAINLDGGGSSAMFIADVGGLVNRPSRGRVENALGLADDVAARRGEREVMNHLTVIAPRPELAVTAADTLAALPSPIVPITVPARQGSFRIGVAREWLAPMTSAGVLALGVGVAIALVRRVARLARRSVDREPRCGRRGVGSPS